MKFVKMHGCGNDYVYLDAVTDPSIEKRLGTPGWAKLVRTMSNRHTGIGSDGVIAVCAPSTPAMRAGASVRMRMFNADGSESQMCGNGVRCVAKFAHERLGARGPVIKVQTGAGVLPIEIVVRRGKVTSATVDMGVPREGLRANRVDAKALAFRGVGVHWGVDRDGVVLIGVFVSMGNPHMVVFEPADARRDRTMTSDDVQSIDLERLGPMFEAHPAFKERINVHFAGMPKRRGGADRIVMRTWERGAGITQACGTGACAVAVAGVLTGRSKRDVQIELPGGTLRVRWDTRSKHVYMTGEAIEVYEGDWPIGGRQ
ncbi:MAG: diaminopimelate epimerase [Phycisphaerales bacterium]|nr:diaminopimelate epimerase [Phycisphaerales bacterium]